MRSFGNNKKALEGGLKHKCRHSRQKNTSVQNTVMNEQIAGACKPDKRLDKNNPKKGKERPQNDNRVDNHRKITVGQLLFTFTEGAGHDRAAPGTKHKSKSSDNHNNRPYNIHRRQRHIAHQIRNEKSVHNTVNRGHDHHHDRRQRKAK